MLNINQKVREVTGVTPDNIPQTILTSEEPIIIKGLVRHWPVVLAALKSNIEADAYIRRFYKGAPVRAFVGPAEINGRYFYNEDLSGFNFLHLTVTLDSFLHKVLAHANDSNPPALFVGAAGVDHCLPGFRQENDIAALSGDDPLVSVWIGNQSRIAAHFDQVENIACCVAGKRRFTLFPPEQLGNLYVGPLDFTPAGQSISLVDFHRIDYGKFPKFREAITAAQVAELEPGDALFLPSMWWHHVESLGSFNMLVNFWWRQSPQFIGSGIRVLKHALMNLRDLPEAEKQAWQNLFNHYVFNNDPDTVAHMPEQSRGILGPMDETQATKIRTELKDFFNR